MPIKFNPKPGHLLNCNFKGFVTPEMVKTTRPVIVVAQSRASQLSTIVPLSKKVPGKIEPWHVEIPAGTFEGCFPLEDSWAKCDMIYTLSHSRFDRVHYKLNEKRIWMSVKIPDEWLDRVIKATKIGLGFLDEKKR